MQRLVHSAILALVLPLAIFAQQGSANPQPSTTPTPAALSTGPVTGQHYTNSNGKRVHSPMKAPSAPAGASAKCRDNTYSFSQHARGTCSHHGGVALWLVH